MEYTKRLLVLEGLLSTLPDCQGWMIAKCRFSLGNRKMKTSDQFPLQILKKEGGWQRSTFVLLQERKKIF